MLQPNSRLIAFSAFIVFAAAITFAFLFHSYELAVSGLLIVIVLTAFIPGWKSTLFAALLSMILMTALVVYFKETDSNVLKALLAQLYSLLVIVFTTVIVFYLKRLQQNLAHEKTHMTSLFENATEGILLTDKSGSIILANQAAQKMFDYTESEMKGKTIELLIPQRFREKHTTLRETFYKKPGNRSMGTGRDLYAKRKDNTEFPVEVSLSHYMQKSEPFVIAFIVDITTRKEYEQNLLKQKIELEKISAAVTKLNAELEGKVEQRTLILKEALQKLEQSQQELSEALDKEKQLNEIKSRFVSMASHEFRTPLSTILSSATLVSKYPGTDEFDKREKHINRIKDSVNHLNELLEDFLSLGKLEEGKVTMTISSFMVKQFIEEVVDEMRGQLKKGQQLFFDYKGEDFFVTDKRMLKNILLNLTGNAIKFSGEEKPIHLVAVNNGEKLEITVTDKGLGISAEDLPHLFATFYRGKNVTNIQGTGLGLPIVKRYLDMMNGEISVKTVINEGSEFTIMLEKMKMPSA